MKLRYDRMFNWRSVCLRSPTVLLNVNGVGYEIDTPLSTFCQLQKGQKVTLWTHLVVREDAQQLYGFSDAQEKQFSAPY